MISKAEMTCPECGAVRLVSKKTIYNNGGVNIKRCLCCAQKDIRKQRFEKKGVYSGATRLVGGGPASQHRFYGVWHTMIVRCTNPKSENYHRYGGRGIKVCNEWLDSVTFLDWCDQQGEIPHGYQIDRINNDGDYMPSNCRFVSPKVNANNKSNSRSKGVKAA